MSKLANPNLAKNAMIQAISALKHMNNSNLVANNLESLDGDITISAGTDDYVVVENKMTFRKKFIVVNSTTTLSTADSGAIVLIENITEETFVNLPIITDDAYSGTHFKFVMGDTGMDTVNLIHIRTRGDNSFQGKVIDGTGNVRYTNNTQIGGTQCIYTRPGDYIEVTYMYNNKWHLNGVIYDTTHFGFVG